MMKLAKVTHDGRTQVVRVAPEAMEVIPLALERAGFSSLGDLLSHPELEAVVARIPEAGNRIAFSEVTWLPPIDRQEVWAAGVTYKRSQTARMEESEAAASCYDRVYRADRPEIFFKATPNRCRGHRGELRIRRDAAWNVPEPEFTLVISRDGRIVGYTIGNDMSSRDIEGDNPLYLPQAKVYSQCCGLGPWITLASEFTDRAATQIGLKIEREGKPVFEGTTSLMQMARTPEELVEWLFRDNEFPEGVMLLTGTGIVPDSSFTLAPADIVTITIDGIGQLQNSIVQG